MATRLSYITALAVMVICLPGCSLLITYSGITLRDLDSRQIVHDRFGAPDTISVVDLTDPNSEEIRQFEVEHYHIHAKFNTAMPIGAGGPFLLLFEPYMTCSALYDAGKEYVEGHDLEFVYDEHGDTIGYKYPQSFYEMAKDRPCANNVLNWKPASISGSE